MTDVDLEDWGHEDCEVCKKAAAEPYARAGTDSMIPESWPAEVLFHLAAPTPFEKFLPAPSTYKMSRRLRFKVWRRSRWADIRYAIARRVYPEGSWEDD